MKKKQESRTRKTTKEPAKAIRKDTALADNPRLRGSGSAKVEDDMIMRR